MLNTINFLQGIVSDLHIAVIGDLMLDRYWFGTTGKTIHPEHPELPLLEIERCVHMPGGAANVAMNVEALGSKVDIFGTLGDDAEGEELCSLLGNAGIPVGSIFRDPYLCTTTTKTRIINQDGQMMRIDRESGESVLPPSEERMAKYISRSLSDIDAVVLSDYNNGFLSDRILGTVFNALENTSIPIIVDPKRADFSVYAGASVLTPNFTEAATALEFMGAKLPVNDLESIKALMTAAKCENLVLKCGAGGTILYRSCLHRWKEDHLYSKNRYPAWPCKSPDVAGAGDTLVAMLTTALAAGLDIFTATALGNLAAGVSVSKPLTATVTLDECKTRLWNKEVSDVFK